MVRLADGSVEIDIAGKKRGRGAYLCFREECWQSGLGGGKLEYALKTTLTREGKERLIVQRKDLLRGES